MDRVRLAAPRETPSDGTKIYVSMIGADLQIDICRSPNSSPKEQDTPRPEYRIGPIAEADLLVDKELYT